MAYHTRSLLKSKKAQFFVLSAFTIVTILYFVSRWIEPYTIIDTSSVVLVEEPFVFNNIVEKTNEVISISKSPEDLKYNIDEYKLFIEQYALSKNLKLNFDISQLIIGNPTTGFIFIQMSSPRMTINRTLLVSEISMTTTTTSTSTTTTTIPSPWKTGWQYRKAITISNSGSALTDYQILVTTDTSSLISAGKMRSDCGDMRFTGSDAVTDIKNYWIESGCNSASTKIWVKVPSVPAGSSTIYMYYGNPSTTSVSNGTNTFVFFDDFTGSSLNTNIWQKVNGGTPSFSNGLMTISASGNPGKLIAKTALTDNNYVLRAKFEVTGGSNGDERGGLSILTDISNGLGYNYVFHGFTTLNTVQFLDDNVVWGTSYSMSWSKSTWYTEEIYYNGSDVNGRFNDGSWNSWGRSGRTGYPALNFGGYDATTVWDFATVRKYASIEPTTSIGVEETP